MSVFGLQGAGFPTARYPVGTMSRNTMRNVFGQSEISGWSSSAAAKPTGRLEDEDYEYLSSNWNPQNMSRKDYNEFLDFLQWKGIISEEDKNYARGIRHSTGEAGTWYSPLDPVHNFADGNVLAFVRYQSSLIYDHETTETKRGVDLYKKITSIMEEMVRRRGTS